MGARAFYVHIPFCEHICAYCDFVRCGYHEQLADDYLEALIQEIRLQDLSSVETVYIGGGTPSVLSTAQLSRLLTALKPCLQQAKEITMEANVENLSEEKVELFQSFGGNRFSIGVQSFDDGHLKRMNRLHNKAQIMDCIEMIRKKGIVNISIDLMYSLPFQTMEQWQCDLKEALGLKVPHISLYSLTIEENSKFNRLGLQPCDNETEGKMYELACTLLAEAGYEHYEVSNFAKHGYASLHNRMYWRYEDFIGVGCGASGKEHHCRYDHPFRLDRYLQSDFGRQVTQLTQKDEMFEHLMMSLRMAEGLDIERFNQCYQVDFLQQHQAMVERYVGKKMLVLEDGYLKPSELGMCFLNDILVDFMD